MKKIYLIFIFMLVMLGVMATSVCASNTTITFNGQGNVAPGSVNKITLNLNSIDKIGGIMGVIEKNVNITNIKLTAKNGWNILSYNEENGRFNMVKNEGAKVEEIMEIEYTASNTEGMGKIEVKNMKVSEIENYDEEALKDISKEIKIEKTLHIDNYDITQEDSTKYIGQIIPNTGINALKQNIKTNGIVKIYKDNTEVTNSNELIATGMVIKIKWNNNEEIEYTAIVTGDLTGNGKMGIGDLSKLSRYAAGLDNTLSGAYLKASDILKNGKYGGIANISKMSRVLAGMDNL